jgi:hypothetical protein
MDDIIHVKKKVKKKARTNSDDHQQFWQGIQRLFDDMSTYLTSTELKFLKPVYSKFDLMGEELKAMKASQHLYIKNQTNLNHAVVARLEILEQRFNSMIDSMDSSKYQSNSSLTQLQYQQQLQQQFQQQIQQYQQQLQTNSNNNNNVAIYYPVTVVPRYG